MTQPEALRLADALDRAPYSSPCTNDAAAELRRLHIDKEGLYHTVAAQAKQIIELVEALRIVVDSDDKAARQHARAALAKVEASK